MSMRILFFALITEWSRDFAVAYSFPEVLRVIRQEIIEPHMIYFGGQLPQAIIDS